MILSSFNFIVFNSHAIDLDINENPSVILIHCILPDLIKALGDVDTSVRSASCNSILSYFYIFPCGFILKKKMFLSDNARQRECLLTILYNAASSIGKEFVKDLLSVPWAFSTILLLYDDKKRIVRDASLKLLEAIYRHDKSIKSTIKNSPLRPTLIKEILSTFEASEQQSENQELTIENIIHTIAPLNLKNKQSFKDEITIISDTLQAKIKGNWKEQVDALSKLQSIVLGCLDTFDKNMSSLKSIWINLNTILGEFRPALIKEATQLLSLLSYEKKEKFAPIADLFLDTLLKLHGNSSKVISEASEQCILTFIKYTMPHGLPQYILAYSSDKNNLIRLKCSLYLYKILETSPIAYIEKHVDNLEQSTKKYLVDSDQKARFYARKGFLFLKQHWPFRAEKLFESLDLSTRSAIIKEQKNDDHQSSDKTLTYRVKEMKIDESKIQMHLESIMSNIPSTKTNDSIQKPAALKPKLKRSFSMTFDLSKVPKLPNETKPLTTTSSTKKPSVLQNIDINKNSSNYPLSSTNKLKKLNKNNNDMKAKSLDDITIYKKSSSLLSLQHKNIENINPNITKNQTFDKTQKKSTGLINPVKSQKQIVINLLPKLSENSSNAIKLITILKKLTSTEIRDLLKKSGLFSTLNELLSSKDPIIRMRARDCFVILMGKIGDGFNVYFNKIDPVYQKLIKSQSNLKKNALAY